MELLPRVKFTANIAANGDVVPGAAFAGFTGSTLGTQVDTLPIYYLLLEDGGGSGQWVIMSYDASKTTGSRATWMQTSDVTTVFESASTGHTCSFVAPPLCYAAVTPDAFGDVTTSYAESYDALALGRYAYIGTRAPSSVAVGGAAAVAAACPRSVAIGAQAVAERIESTAVGFKSVARSGLALGAYAKCTNDGEMVLGSEYMPHVSFLPIKAPATVANGGTFVFLTVRSAVPGGSQTTVAFDTWMNSNSSAHIVRVTGTVSAATTDDADRKVFSVDFAITNGGAGAVLYSTFTALHTGTANRAISLSLNASKLLQVTSPVLAGLQVSGLLQLEKIRMF